MPKKYRNVKQNQKGGYGPGAGPVGSAWNADPNTWPGVASLYGADTQGIMTSNHYSLSPYGGAVGGVEIAEPGVKFSDLTGGARKRKNSKKSKKRSNKHKNSKKTQMRKKKYGRKTMRKHRRPLKMRGGFGPQDVVNVFSGIGHGLSNTFNNFMGYQHSPNPSPLEQPINSNDFPQNVIAPNPINLKRSFDIAGRSVAQL